MATLRIRMAEIQRAVDERYPSEEQFIRDAEISRTAWNNLRKEDRKRVDLEVLAKVLSTLGMNLADILEYDPDEKAS